MNWNELYTTVEGKIDWLSDRIQPVVEVKMPDAVVPKAEYEMDNFFITPWQNNEYEVNKSTYEKQDGQWLSYPLGVFILSTPKRVEVNKQVYRDADAYDGLVILKDDKFTERYTVQEGIRYTDAMVAILETAGITKYNIEQSDKVLPATKEWGIGTDKLSAINELASALNYTPFWVDEYGYYTASHYTSPQDKSADHEYADDELSVTYNGMEEELDLFDTANVFTLVLSDTEREPLVSTIENNSAESPTSIPNRGRRIVDFREIQDAADQEALDGQCQRIADAASQVYGHLDFSTAIIPTHGYSDVIRVVNSTLGIDGKYAETEWKMDLTGGGKMAHSVRKVVSLNG